MKKLKIFLISGFLICTAGLTACGENSSETTLESQPNTADIAGAVLDAVEFPSATSKTLDEINDYIDINIENVYQMSYYICGSGAYPDELLILKLKDKDFAADIKKSVQQRLNNQIETYRDYTPDEMYKLDGANITVRDNWIFYFATSDNDKTEEIINSFFK